MYAWKSVSGIQPTKEPAVKLADDEAIEEGAQHLFEVFQSAV